MSTCKVQSEKISIQQCFGVIQFSPEIKHTVFEVPSPKCIGTKAVKGIITRLF